MQILRNSNTQTHDVFSSAIGYHSAQRSGKGLAIAALLLTLSFPGGFRMLAQSGARPESVLLRLSDSRVTGENGLSNATLSSEGTRLVPAVPSSSLLEPVRIPIVAEPDVSANPGRPAMATSALLTPVGYAQIENGLLYAADSAEFSGRDGLEETVRVTVTPRLQFIVSAEPIAWSVTDKGDSSQRGDVDGGVQVVAWSGRGAKPTIAMSYLRLVRSGSATDLDIGGYANSAILMASSDFGRCHVDANGFLNETEGQVRRLQFGQAVALSHPITAKLSGTAEVRHFTEPLTGGNGFSTLWAVGYALHPNLVFDAGVVRGFTESSTRWQIASGFTYVLPQRIWGFSR